MSNRTTWCHGFNISYHFLIRCANCFQLLDSWVTFATYILKGCFSEVTETFSITLITNIALKRETNRTFTQLYNGAVELDCQYYSVELLRERLGDEPGYFGKEIFLLIETLTWKTPGLIRRISNQIHSSINFKILLLLNVPSEAWNVPCEIRGVSLFRQYHGCSPFYNALCGLNYRLRSGWYLFRYLVRDVKRGSNHDVALIFATAASFNSFGAALKFTI